MISLLCIISYDHFAMTFSYPSCSIQHQIDDHEIKCGDDCCLGRSSICRCLGTTELQVTWLRLVGLRTKSACLKSSGESINSGSIQMVTGLIEQQQVARYKSKGCQRHSCLLPSTQVPCKPDAIPNWHKTHHSNLAWLELTQLLGSFASSKLVARHRAESC